MRMNTTKVTMLPESAFSLEKWEQKGGAFVFDATNALFTQEEVLDQA
jgi:hypothetical protein